MRDYDDEYEYEYEYNARGGRRRMAAVVAPRASVGPLFDVVAPMRRRVRTLCPVVRDDDYNYYYHDYYHDYHDDRRRLRRRRCRIAPHRARRQR